VAHKDKSQEVIAHSFACRAGLRSQIRTLFAQQYREFLARVVNLRLSDSQSSSKSAVESSGDQVPPPEILLGSHLDSMAQKPALIEGY
jgi:hypothetical protein